MLKKFLLAIAALIMTMGIAFAQVDVNKADQAALDGVKGIGPATSKTIIEERKKNGPFKDWADFQKRVKGIGDKSSDKLSAAGLTVNGKAKDSPSVSAKAEVQGTPGDNATTNDGKAGGKDKTKAKDDVKKPKAKDEKSGKASASASASSKPASAASAASK